MDEVEALRAMAKEQALPAVVMTPEERAAHRRAGTGPYRNGSGRTVDLDVVDGLLDAEGIGVEPDLCPTCPPAAPIGTDGWGVIHYPDGTTTRVDPS